MLEIFWRNFEIQESWDKVNLLPRVSHGLKSNMSIFTLKFPINKQTSKEGKTIPGIANLLDYPWRGSPNQETRISTLSSLFLFDSLPTALGPGKKFLRTPFGPWWRCTRSRESSSQSMLPVLGILHSLGSSNCSTGLRGENKFIQIYKLMFKKVARRGQSGANPLFVSPLLYHNYLVL